MALPKQSGFNFHDHAADPAADGETNRHKEEIKAHLEGAVQKLVMLRYPGVNPGLNLLRNPSFEVDADGVNPPTGWTQRNTVAVDDAENYDGSKSALIAAAQGSGTYCLQSISVAKGQYIKATVACKASTAAHGRFLVTADGGDYAGGTLFDDYHTGGGGWEVLSGIYGPFTSDTVVTILCYKQTATATDIWFDQAVLEVSGAPIKVIYAVDDVADPPTDAELDTAFGDPTVVGSGFIGILDDNDAGTDVYICFTTGAAGEWFYIKGTKAV